MQNPADMLTQLSLDDIQGICRVYSSPNQGGNEVELANRNTQNLLSQLHGCTPANLAECNQAIVNYLNDETNQNESIYSLLANAFVAKASGAEALILDPKATKAPIIAGLTAWQLTHFYRDALQASVLEVAHKKYLATKREKTQSPASLELSQCLASNQSTSEKWRTLVAFCSNPQNKPRRFFKIIESTLKDISIKDTCLSTYKEACDLIKLQVPEVEAHRNYQRAMLLLSCIPTYGEDTRADSPLGSFALLAAYSEILERTQQYQVALELFEAAYPDQSVKSTRQNRLSRTGFFYYSQYFPGDSEARKVKLFLRIFEGTLNQTVLTENANSVAKQRFTLFARSWKNPIMGTIALECATLTPVMVASYIVPPVGVAMTIGVGLVLLGGMIGSSIHGGVHAASRKPLDMNGLNTLFSHLQQFHRESEEVKAEFLRTVVERYYIAKTAACSDSSMKLLRTLESYRVPANERWNYLLYYMCKEIDRNNGKKMAVIIRELLEERYPSETSMQSAGASK